jgi:hypothetical protein
MHPARLRGVVNVRVSDNDEIKLLQGFEVPRGGKNHQTFHQTVNFFRGHFFGCGPKFLREKPNAIGLIRRHEQILRLSWI